MNQDKPLLLIADDTPENIDVLAGILKEQYQIRVATNGSIALKLAQLDPKPDLILLDIMMPDMDGFEVCRQLKLLQKTQNIPIIFVTARMTTQDEIKGFELGAVDYITKPIVPTVAKRRIQTQVQLSNQKQALYLQVQEKTQEINQSKLELLERLGRAAEYKDNETGLHVKRMSNYAYHLAKACGFSDEDADVLREVAPMHDLGKIGIPDGILLKQGKLDDDEWAIMRNHVQIGVDILGDCSGSRLMQMAKTVAQTHHEKWDGTGYPHGLSGEEIPLSGRICGIADVFDALTSQRPYKRAWSLDEAFTFLQQQKGHHFDPTLVELFLGLRSEIEQIMNTYQEPESES
ncbi:HD-GYP domain-containing protein [Vibrio gallicus]|uniref:HD-GYP domain-containing protein n=1 Tax=Vibrio gallicus TaxID=190897 RepID=UPI0021C3BB22|nr:two-component system response regulator [Vibrio gallicus]